MNRQTSDSLYYLNNVPLNEISNAAASVSMNSHKITTLATPTANADCATKGYVDGIALPYSTLNSVPAPTESVSLNSQKITSLADATDATDAINRQVGDANYYLSTTTLNSLTAPAASVSLNSQKITNLANATLATDAINR